jgi:hypothetical protein
LAWPFGRLRFALLGVVAIFVIWKVSTSLGHFWFFPDSEALLGDLRDRYREFHFFSKGLDPKAQDPLLGYPAWSYLMAGFWAWPESFDRAKFLFLAIQAVAMAVVGYDLMERLRLGLPAMILVALASAPIYVLLDLLGLGNYGIIEAAFFYFSMLGRSPAVRGLALVGSILKPQTGLAVWLAALGRRDWRVIGVSGGVVVLLLAIASKVLGQSSVGSFFMTMQGGFGGRLDHFYSTGNYGCLSNAVQAGWITPAVAVAICYLLLAVSLGLVFKYVFDPMARYVFAAALFPLFTYHRTHDLILIWPVLIILVVSSFRQDGWKGWFWIAPLAWSLTFHENQPVPVLLFFAMVLIWWHWLLRGSTANSVATP